MSAIDTEKEKAFMALLDGLRDKAKEMLSAVDATEKDADAMGLAYKDKPLSELTPDELLEYAIARKEAELEAEKARKSPPDEDEEDEDEMDEEEMPMSRRQFKAAMDEYHGKMEAMMQKMMGGKATKDDKLASVAEAQGLQAKRIKDSEAQLASLKEKLQKAESSLAELKGDVPAALKNNGYRPTADPSTAISEEALKAMQPADVPLSGFVDFLMNPGNNAG